MLREARYTDVVREVGEELLAQAEAAERAGVAHERIWLDPGIGFAKRAQAHSVVLLARLPELVALGYPVLVGPSRKSFLGALTGAPVRKRGSPARSPLPPPACWAARARCACTTSPRRARRSTSPPRSATRGRPERDPVHLRVGPRPLGDLRRQLPAAPRHDRHPGRGLGRVLAAHADQGHARRTDGARAAHPGVGLATREPARAGHRQLPARQLPVLGPADLDRDLPVRHPPRADPGRARRVRLDPHPGGAHDRGGRARLSGARAAPGRRAGGDRARGAARRVRGAGHAARRRADPRPPDLDLPAVLAAARRRGRGAPRPDRERRLHPAARHARQPEQLRSAPATARRSA